MLGYRLFNPIPDLARAVSRGSQAAPTNICAKRRIGSYDEDSKFVPHKQFDVLLTDMKENDLFDLGEAFHMKNLAPGSFSNLPFPAQGRIHGIHHRLMVLLVCQYSERSNSIPYNVWFIVNPGAPYTYLSVRSLETVVGPGFSRDIHTFSIQDPSVNIECRTSHDHFFDFNILGMDVIREFQLSIIMDWKLKTFQLIQM